jgi:GT2 family glycosyltransferase
MAIVREVFHELGGFPETGLHGLEDSIFSSAVARRWPEQVRFVQRMSVRHLGRTSVPQLWAHQAVFGYARGLLRFKLKPVHERLGRNALMVVPVALKRLSYILRRTVAWRPLMFVKIVVLLPLLVLGLLAWASGFRRGLRESDVSTSENRWAGSELLS